MTPYLKYDSVSDTESFIMTPYSKYSPLKNIHSWKIFTPEKYSPLKNIHPWTIFTPEKYSPLKNIQYKIFFEGRIWSHLLLLHIEYGWIFDMESSNCAISPLCNARDCFEHWGKWTIFILFLPILSEKAHFWGFPGGVDRHLLPKYAPRLEQTPRFWPAGPLDF